MADQFVATTGVRRGSFGWSSMENTTGVARKRSTFDYDHDDDDDDDQPSVPSFICDGDNNNNNNSMVFLQDYSLAAASSCSTYDWNNNHVLIDAANEMSESNYNSAEQEDVTNYRQTDWSSSGNVSLMIGAKEEQVEDYSSTIADFPMNGSLNMNSYSYNSSFVHSLLHHDDQDHDEPRRPQQSFYTNNQFLPSWSKLSPNNFTKPLISKHLHSNNLHTSSSLPFWTTNTVDGSVETSVPQQVQRKPCNSLYISSTSSFHPQMINPAYEEKTNCIKPMKSSNSEPTFKRPRIQTPSPLPTFKVRKEKLGDRITALQQLVSPFGKTDTASVLHEAIEYIKFLHDQVGVLSSPYMKSSSQNPRPQQMPRKMKDLEVAKQGLRTRGLCLVPISSTYPVENEATSDFWTPTFGGTFR